MIDLVLSRGSGHDGFGRLTILHDEGPVAGARAAYLECGGSLLRLTDTAGKTIECLILAPALADRIRIDQESGHSLEVEVCMMKDWEPHPIAIGRLRPALTVARAP